MVIKTVLFVIAEFSLLNLNGLYLIFEIGLILSSHNIN